VLFLQVPAAGLSAPEDTKVTSAHCVQVSHSTSILQVGKGNEEGTHVVQPPSRLPVPIRNRLNRCVLSLKHSSRQPIHARHLDHINTEVAEALLAEGLEQRDVEVRAGVVAEADEELDGGLVVPHKEVQGEAGWGDFGAVQGGGILAAAGEGGEGVFVEAAGGGEFELEVGGDEGEQGEEREEDGDMHCGLLGLD
jgi:hypothetical protein